MTAFRLEAKKIAPDCPMDMGMCHSCCMGPRLYVHGSRCWIASNFASRQVRLLDRYARGILKFPSEYLSWSVYWYLTVLRIPIRDRCESPLPVILR
jgi:hypothetical protein